MKPKSGIYFLFLKKELVYIGKTENFPNRLKTHNKVFDRVRFIECDPSVLLHYERRLISYFKPSQNINSKDTSLKNMIPVSSALFDDIRTLAEHEQRMFTRQIEYMILTYIRSKKAEPKYGRLLKSA